MIECLQEKTNCILNITKYAAKSLHGGSSDYSFLSDTEEILSELYGLELEENFIANTLVVKSLDGLTTYDINVDYRLSDKYLFRASGSTIPENTKVNIIYNYNVILNIPAISIVKSTEIKNSLGNSQISKMKLIIPEVVSIENKDMITCESVKLKNQFILLISNTYDSNMKVTGSVIYV